MISVKVKSVLYTECVPEWNWDTRRDPLKDYDLWYIARGEGLLKTSHGSFSLGWGCCFILRPGEGFLVTHNRQKPLAVYAAHFDFTSSSDSLPFAQIIEDIHFFEKLFRRLVESEEIYRGIWISAILNEYLEVYKRKIYRPTLNEERAGKIKKYIKTHLEEHLSLDKLSELVFLSRNQTTRVFKEITGETIQDYIIN